MCKLKNGKHIERGSINGIQKKKNLKLDNEKEVSESK